MAEAAIKHPPGKGDELQIRWAEEKDLPQMLELVRVGLGEGSIPRTEAFWRWKHEQNPFGRSPAMVVEADGRIVSLRTFLRWRWRHGDRTLKAVRPVDTATHPDWRRRGLFERLTRELIEAMREEGVAFVFNTPNPKSSQGYQKLGWRLVGRPTIWIRPLKPIRVIKALWRRGQEGADSALARETISPTTVLSPPDLEDFLAIRQAASGRIATDVDAAYLQWRYRDCPGLDYGADGAFDRRSGALLVYRQTKQFGLRELRICDLFVTEDKPSRRKAKEMVRDRLGAFDGDFASARTLPGTPAAAVLRRLGFFPAPRIGPVLAFRPLFDPSDLPAINQLATWDAAIGDLELF
jgi:GNAT superfamily N-acetyltransferase